MQQNQPPANVASTAELGLAPKRDDWLHLKAYGYAPGHYMNTCCKCGQTAVDVDKRATSCRPCAEAKHAYSKPPCQQCGAMTEDEATSRCMGRAAGDGCHGTDLWPG